MNPCIKVYQDVLRTLIEDLQAEIDELNPQIMTQVFCERLGLDLSDYPGVSDLAVEWDWHESSSMQSGEAQVSYTFTRPDGHVIRVQYDRTYTFRWYDCDETDEKQSGELTVDGTEEYEYADAGPNAWTRDPPCIGLFQSDDDDDESDDGESRDVELRDVESKNWASLMNDILDKLCVEHVGSYNRYTSRYTGWQELMHVKV